MFTISSAELNALLAAFVYPFFRVIGLLVSEPIFGNQSISPQLRVGIAIVLTVIIAPAIGDMPNVPIDSGIGLLIVVQQLLIGFAMGLALRVVLSGIEMAGHFGGMQMGLAFANFYDPQNSTQTPVLGQFMGMIGLLVFLSMNGHLMVISALSESFQLIPITTKSLSAVGWRTLAEWGGNVFSIGVLLSMPIIAALLITNIAIGIMTRAAPQLNIFAVGFPITLLAGFIVLMMSLPYLLPHIERYYQEGIQVVLTVLKGNAGN
jgi:flagellar biosynthetic protein FliR